MTVLLTSYENDDDYDDYRSIEFSLVVQMVMFKFMLMLMTIMTKSMLIIMIRGALSSHWWSKCSILSPFKLTHTLFQVKPLE